jgi:hypothetical protein
MHTGLSENVMLVLPWQLGIVESSLPVQIEAHRSLSGTYLNYF